MEKTREVIKKTDIAVIVIDGSSVGQAGGLTGNNCTKKSTERTNSDEIIEKNKSATKTEQNIIDLSERIISEEIKLFKQLNSNNIPVIFAINYADKYADNYIEKHAEIQVEKYVDNSEKNIVVMINSIIEKNVLETASIGSSADSFSDKNKSLSNILSNQFCIPVSAVSGEGIEELRAAIINAANSSNEKTIIGDLVNEGDSVLLVMPQDKQAPRGRLILPQVTTVRELLDKHCIVTSVSTEQIDDALNNMKKPPKLIITDSQVFDIVYGKKPPESMLTSFSILYAGLKGDVKTYIEGARSIENLTAGARILIAESCSHAPMEEDIGRVKIPAMIQTSIDMTADDNKQQSVISVDVCAGSDFPTDLSDYDLVIQCGGCMSNRRAIMSRIEQAREQGVPITNYGICIAWLKGILDSVIL
ncbi:MAG: [FeFe] hydrogenase H-cluster maturation GTPase HydF [Eubacterium sp.]|nr:[FeFe] hydrogenase H-cluster maturation GTPase HydF [Eubacterium sp.]